MRDGTINNDENIEHDLALLNSRRVEFLPLEEKELFVGDNSRCLLAGCYKKDVNTINLEYVESFPHLHVVKSIGVGKHSTPMDHAKCGQTKNIPRRIFGDIGNRSQHMYISNILL